MGMTLPVQTCSSRCKLVCPGSAQPIRWRRKDQTSISQGPATPPPPPKSRVFFLQFQTDRTVNFWEFSGRLQENKKKPTLSILSNVSFLNSTKQLGHRALVSLICTAHCTAFNLKCTKKEEGKSILPTWNYDCTSTNLTLPKLICGNECLLSFSCLTKMINSATFATQVIA